MLYIDDLVESVFRLTSRPSWPASTRRTPPRVSRERPLRARGLRAAVALARGAARAAACALVCRVRPLLALLPLIVFTTFWGSNN